MKSTTHINNSITKKSHKMILSRLFIINKIDRICIYSPKRISQSLLIELLRKRKLSQRHKKPPTPVLSRQKAQKQDAIKNGSFPHNPPLANTSLRCFCGPHLGVNFLRAMCRIRFMIKAKIAPSAGIQSLIR
jgi:hypothetical protein